MKSERFRIVDAGRFHKLYIYLNNEWTLLSHHTTKAGAQDRIKRRKARYVKFDALEGQP